MIRKRFDEKVIKLVDVGVQNLRGHFKDGVLKACDEVCLITVRKKSTYPTKCVISNTIVVKLG